MNWTQEELDLIEKYRIEIDSDSEKFIEKCLTDLEIVAEHKTLTRVILGLCLLLDKPIFLEVSKNPEIKVGVEANGSLLLVMYTELNEEIKGGFEEIQKEFFEDLINYYKVDRDTAEKICRLTHRGK